MNTDRIRLDVLRSYPSATALLTAYFEATHQSTPKSLLIARSIDAELCEPLAVNAKIKAASRAAKDEALDSLIDVVPLPVLRSEISAICDSQKCSKSNMHRQLALESLKNFLERLEAVIC